MNELFDIIVERGGNIGILEVVGVFLAWKIHKELFQPLRAFLLEATKQLKEGGFSHNGVIHSLNNLDSTLKEAHKK